MKSLKESINESIMNESIIEAGATIWALGQIISIGLGGIAIPASIIFALIERNKNNKKLKESVKEFNNFFNDYREQINDKEKYPTWYSLAHDPIEKITGISFLSLDLMNEAKEFMSKEDFYRFNQLASNLRFKDSDKIQKYINR